MQVLVDTSIWVGYFRSGRDARNLEFLIDEDIVAINDLVLSELVSFLQIRNEKKLVSLLYELKKLDMQIEWGQIIEFQVKCLRNGVNGIGIPDLLIAQNALQNGCALYSRDSHFMLMKDILDLRLFP
jgi:predicted nucleic acid-binding protein